MPHAPLSFPSLPCDTRSASSHLPRPWSPHHPLRSAMCSQTCSPPPAPSALRPAEDTETVIGGASVRYMGAEATIACCTAADACCLCAPQDRLRALLRVSPSSWALSACILRAAHGYVRLAACGVRGEERGRDARATGWRAEVRDISGAHMGISRDPMRLWA